MRKYNENIYCLYFHFTTDLENNYVFYVGIGNLKRPFGKKRRSKHWKSVYKKHGCRVLILYKNLSWEMACHWETYYIYYFGRKDLGEGKLINKTDGGDGAKGMHHTKEWKKEQSRRSSGKNNPNFGGKAITEYQRRIASETAKKQWENENIRKVRIKNLQILGEKAWNSGLTYKDDCRISRNCGKYERTKLHRTIIKENNSKKLVVIKRGTKELLEFNSRKETGKYFNIDSCMIGKALEGIKFTKGKSLELNDYKFYYLTK